MSTILNGRFLISIKYVIPIIIAAFTVGSFYYQITAMAEDLEETINRTKDNTRSVTNTEINQANVQVLLERYATGQEDIRSILNGLKSSEERQNFLIELILQQQGIFMPDRN